MLNTESNKPGMNSRSRKTTEELEEYRDKTVMRLADHVKTTRSASRPRAQNSSRGRAPIVEEVQQDYSKWVRTRLTQEEAVSCKVVRAITDITSHD